MLNSQTQMRIDAIFPGKNNPRKHFADADIAELSRSIAEKGVLQPIIARQTNVRGRYEIVAGERRWRAARLANLRTVPVVVRNLSEAEALEIAIIENVQREDLNPIEEAQAYSDLIRRHGYTQESLGEVIGKSRSHIANILRLLQLPLAVQRMVAEEKLSAGHARTLVNVPNAEAIAAKMVTSGWTVRDAERLKQGAPGHKPHRKAVVDYRLLDGRLLSAVSWDEVSALLRAAEREVAILRAVKGHFAHVTDGTKKVGSLMSMTAIAAIVDTVDAQQRQAAA